MMDVRSFRPRASTCRIDSARSATPLPGWRGKNPSTSAEALAADPHQGTLTHGDAVASSQKRLWAGVSGRSHFGQSRAADRCPDPSNLPVSPCAHAGTENEPGHTQYSY